MKFSKIIAKERAKRKWSQQELADLLGVSQGAINKYELGTRKPSDKNKVKIAKLFNMSVEDIFLQKVNTNRI